jgi:hypothetical protein
MVQVSSAALGLLLAWLAWRRRDGRWVARVLWWWAWGSLPAAVTFRFGGLVNSPRFYALGAVGVVMLWADVIVELGAIARPAWARRLIWSLLAAAIALPNLSFLLLQRQVHLSLNHVYRQILEAAREAEHEPLGFVNVPAWLAPRRQTYALSKDGVVGLPLYTNVREFIGVNLAWREADNVMFVHTLYEPQDLFFGFHGDWLDWEQMRQFALDHRTVWLTRYEEGRFELHHVGSIRAAEGLVGPGPLAWFEGGPAVESASVRELGEGRWALELTWRASESAPTGGEVFVHVVDGGGNLVAQADGPALGGMVPLALWRPGDRVVDVRHLVLPQGGGPLTVLVGIYDPGGRFPAFTGDGRCANDAVPVAVIDF